MITARNYAAQAERSLCSMSKKYAECGFTNDGIVLQEVSKKIADSVHFALPDGGRIFNDRLRGISGQTPKLPFDRITIEYFIEECFEPTEYLTFNAKKRLVIAEQTTDGIAVIAAWAENDKWTVGSAGYLIPNKWEAPKDIIPAELQKYTQKYADLRKYRAQEQNDKEASQMVLVMIGPYVILPDTYGYSVKQHGKKTADELCLCDLQPECEAVLELIEALTCRNVTTEPLEKIDQRVNERRVKAGKLPIYETKVLTLKVNETVKQSGKTGFSHASPRQHLRRGHIRRHPTAGNIWVNNCVVGSAEKGFIEKQYKIAA